MADWTSSLDFGAVDEALAAASVPHGLIYRAPDILEDPQYAAREMVQRIHDEALERDVAMPGVVPRFSQTPGSIRWVGAPVGAHSDQVLKEFGLSHAALRHEAPKWSVE